MAEAHQQRLTSRWRWLLGILLAIAVAVSVFVVAHVGLGWPQPTPAPLGQIPTAGPGGEPLAGYPPMDLSGFPGHEARPKRLACARGTQISPLASSAFVLPWYHNQPGARQAPVLMGDAGELNFFWWVIQDPTTIVKRPDGADAPDLAALLSSSGCQGRFVTLSDDYPLKDGKPVFTQADMARLLFDDTTRRNFLMAVAQGLARYRQIDGLTLDFEQTLPDKQSDLEQMVGLAAGAQLSEGIDRFTRAFNQLVGMLAEVLERQGRVLNVAVVVHGSKDYASAQWVKPFLFDYAQLQAYTGVSGQVIAMAVGAASGGPGSDAPRTWVAEVVKYLQAHMDRRFALELPNYALDWKVDSQGHKLGDPVPLSATDLAQRRMRFEHVPAAHWLNPTDPQGLINYQDAAERHAIWDGGAALASPDLAPWLRGLGVRAVSIWGVGNRDPQGSALAAAFLRTWNS